MKLKQTAILLLLACGLSLPASAAGQDGYSSYYTNMPVQMAQASAPSIPDYRVSVKDFGAKGDGATLDTEAFTKAIAAVEAKGGGHVDVPAGVYLLGPIELKSHIDLHLSQNATLYFSPDASLYVQKEGAKSTRGRVRSAISAEQCTDISITGGGLIDGMGNYWRPVKRSKQSDEEWKNYVKQGGTVTKDGNFFFPKAPEGMKYDALEKLRNDLIRIYRCKNVLLQGVTFQNSPRFHVHPYYCENVIMDGIVVRSPWNAQNADGIDLTNCRQVLIVNTTVDTGDDGICMKGGQGASGKKAGPVSDVLIKNCRVYHAHGGFTIGSDCSGGMKNIVVRNCTYNGTDVGLRFKSGMDRGGKTENVFCDSIYMSNIRGEAIIFENTYVNKDVKFMMGNGTDIDSTKIFLPDFTDVHISNVVCRGAETGILLRGIPQAFIHDITFKNVTISEARKPYSSEYAKGIVLDNVKVNGEEPKL